MCSSGCGVWLVAALITFLSAGCNKVVCTVEVEHGSPCSPRAVVVVEWFEMKADFIVSAKGRGRGSPCARVWASFFLSGCRTGISRSLWSDRPSPDRVFCHSALHDVAVCMIAESNSFTYTRRLSTGQGTLEALSSDSTVLRSKADVPPSPCFCHLTQMMSEC